MARINTNVASLIAQQGLANSQTSLDTSLQRLSTGLRINSGADDPAGLIASDGLKSEIAGINQAVANSSQASNVISTAEGGAQRGFKPPAQHQRAGRPVGQLRSPLQQRDRGQPVAGRFGHPEHHPHRQQHHVCRAAPSQWQPGLRDQRCKHLAGEITSDFTGELWNQPDSPRPGGRGDFGERPRTWNTKAVPLPTPSHCKSPETLEPKRSPSRAARAFPPSHMPLTASVIRPA